jgi:S-DNA-T family DNA segregation ATPase FtsK/SpoIIIE
MNPEQLDKYAKKVRRIFNGKYNIEFENCIYTYSLNDERNFAVNHFFRGIKIEQFNFGSITTKNVLLGNQRNISYDFMHMKKNEKPGNVVFSNEKKHVKDKYEQESKTLEDELYRTNDEQGKSSDKILGNIDLPIEIEQASGFDNISDEEISVSDSVNFNKNIRLIDIDKIVNIFKGYNISNTENEEKDIQQKLDRLDQELKQRKTKVYIQNHIFGPDIIRVELDLATGVNINQLNKFDDDMKYWLSINEKPFIYIKDGKIVMDIIRDNRQMIGLKNMLDEIKNREMINDREGKFYVLLGADIIGVPQLVDLSDSNTPHLLIAGQTGSGKSVLLNSMLLSIMMFYSPNEVEMILVDPKRVELKAFKESVYTKEIIKDADKAVESLENLVIEMNNRYKILDESNSRNISSYNGKVDVNSRMKRILMVIDEYGVLIEGDKELTKRLESAIKVLSQMARAAGIHLIICTQSPRADIITTIIRNNLTARIGLRVADSVASGLILDSSGAETLLGKGDMLLKTAASSEFLRAKSPYVTEGEIAKFMKKCQELYGHE